MPYQHVLAIYDGTPRSEEVLDMICRIGRPHQAQLTMLIVKLVPLTQELPTYAPGADAEVDALVQRTEKLVRNLKVTAATSVRYVRALGPVIVSEARLHAVDLVALAVPDLERLTSDQAEHDDLRIVLRQVSCAVMLLRPSR